MALLGWLVLAVWLGLPSAEPVGFLPFVFGAFAALVVVGRWLARTGLLLALLALLPVLAAVLGGWTAIGDEVLLARGKPVDVLVTAEHAHRLRGGPAYTYDVRNPDGSPESLDPGAGTRLAVGGRVDVVEDPAGLVATQLAGRQAPAVPLVSGSLGAACLVAAVAVTAVAGERRRVRNATTR
ncbi:Uncharacterised protein [Amycolatopsis camponoti]|uniref:DUF3592 domain-containing protein n=1 Tax=Amycolatopsis camponoti TaxID=2606593 RepID=A0A6I8LJY6_9PSEU|nr:Uncharacterised protein [Amycolatopsis camponoti]